MNGMEMKIEMEKNGYIKLKLKPQGTPRIYMQANLTSPRDGSLRVVGHDDDIRRNPRFFS
jgi:hypothetical protein